MLGEAGVFVVFIVVGGGGFGGGWKATIRPSLRPSKSWTRLQIGLYAAAVTFSFLFRERDLVVAVQSSVQI